MKLVWDMTVNLNEADLGVGFHLIQSPKGLQGTPFPGISKPLCHYLPHIKIFLMLTIHYHDLNHSFFIIS